MMNSINPVGNLRDLINRHAGPELQKLVALLTSRYRVARITCFGFKAACRLSPSHGADNGETGNHWFILMETRELYPESAVQEYINHCFGTGKVFVVAHHEGKVRQILESGHRFYGLVRSSGFLMFADRPDPAPVNRFLPDNWQQEADRHFRNHYGMAQSFWCGAAAQLESGQIRVALFLLHQTVEQACIGLIYVFLGYRANFHNLGRLLELCSCFLTPPADLFPGNTPEERRLFRILCRSYTEARYLDEFIVNTEDCREILNNTGAFVRMTEDICLNRLARFREASWI